MSWRKSILSILAAAGLSSAVEAQDYPARSPTIVVPFAAGGPVDINGRETAEALSQKLGKSFIVENRAGAGGVTGMKYVMGANPDGYTLFVGSPGPLVIMPSARPGTLDVLGQMLPIGIISESPQVLVISSKLEAGTVKDLVALARSSSAKMNYGSAGIGTTPHLSAELFKKVAGIDIVHVPYRGTAAAIQDVMRGEISILFGDVATLKPFVESGALKALAITGPERSKLLPSVPTSVEVGYPGLTVRNFSALLVPIATPKPVVDVLVKALNDVKREAGFAGRLAANGMTAVESSPEKARQYIETEAKLWGPLIQTIGLKP